MDKIYTRKRIRIPSVRYVGLKKLSFKKKIAIEITFIMLIAILTLITMISSISPIIDKICEDAAKSKATIISNNMATEVMKRYKYDDLINISKDSNGNISMIQSNIITINEITSDVAVKIQQELINNNDSIYPVKLRELFRS